MTDSNNLESDNDPVEFEFPVLLSTSLADKLYIFQYPIRPASKGYDNTTFLKTSIKPENQEFRIEVGLDCNSANYDQRKGEKIAMDADGPFDRCENDKDRYFQGEYMDKTVLQSSRAVPDCSNYAVGTFQGNELHITPLKSIVQLRPQFNYLEQNEKNKDDESKKNGNESDEEETKAISVTFSRNRTDASKKLQEQSFENHSKKSLEELWIDTQYMNAESTQAQLTRLEMFCSINELYKNSLGVSCKDYLHMLAQSTNSDEHLNINGSANERSSHYMSSRPLLDQIRKILKDAKVISFKQLRSMIDSKHKDTDVLKYLQQVAVLVQGNWVVQNDLVFPKDKTSSQNGINSDLMCRARDYILLTFTENEFVKREEISKVIKLPAEEIEEILTNLATVVPEDGWKLLIPPNTEFTSKHSDIAHRQALHWETKRKQWKELLDALNHQPQRQRQRSIRESIGSENEERNVGRGKKTVRDSSISDDGAAAVEPVKTKKNVKSRKVSETT
ncbi:Similar to Polr3e: DNA-directed RNA polymerase III subunit RPC5 (Mus musculus) [Cotesia congregata]|uniref:Similar to Polr3e: DNA-directed RNA polymerase III subunit RPC5 (Mus musculus) n=1 Tax=Cotesia congregata TaxID=51543 RepID=A0A8J2MQ16_COTCN|nr:Similar to Polr3e: DNA-directed RNA polymerase III subunit RPC5 (Mus musculus) [Cotesia congregata]